MTTLPMLAWKSAAVDQLRRDGIARSPVKFDAAALVRHLGLAPTYNAHVWAKATEPPESLDGALAHRRWPMFCHDMGAIVTAPGLFELAVDALGIAADYFGEEPLLYSMNAFWTQPASGPRYADTHEWHCDGDDRKQLAMFFMGTDVETRDDGAHLYQRGSHVVRLTGDEERAGKRGYDMYRPPEGVVESVTGAAGSIFFTDPWGMHMAPRPQRGPRLLCWARFGVSCPPASYGWDKLAPVGRDKLGDRYPGDEATQRAIRLVVQ